MIGPSVKIEFGIRYQEDEFLISQKKNFPAKKKMKEGGLIIHSNFIAVNCQNENL